MKTEYRLYNRLNCSFFDLISGEQEPKQTKALGLLLSKSPLALEKFLELIYPANKQLRNKLHKCRCIIDCEATQKINYAKNQSNRADIVIRFFEGLTPHSAIIVEAKGWGIKANEETTINQVIDYCDKFEVLEEFKGTITAATLTYNTILSHHEKFMNVENVVNITWMELINALLNVKFSQNKFERELIDDYCNFLLKNKNHMKFYEDDVLSIPAGDSIDSVEKCGIYECPNNKKYQKYNKKALYFSFRAKRGGITQKLYKVKDILSITLGDNDAINALNNIDAEYGSRLRQYIQDRKNVTFVNEEEEKLVFFFDLEETIRLPYPVKPIKNNTFVKSYSLSSFFGNPNEEGCIIL